MYSSADHSLNYSVVVWKGSVDKLCNNKNTSQRDITHAAEGTEPAPRLQPSVC